MAKSWTVKSFWVMKDCHLTRDAVNFYDFS